MKKKIGFIPIDVANAHWYACLIKRKREELKLSQRKLAELCGVAQPMIAKIEKFKEIPRLDTFLKITGALGLYIDLKEVLL